MKLYRNFEINLDTRSDEDRTVEASVSSEMPYQRWDGTEILSHDPKAIDLSRAPLPLLVSHDARQTPVGLVKDLQIIGRKLRGVLRFGKNARATEAWQDVKDGILRNLSIGYEIIKKQTENDGAYRATRWMPYEVSLVAVPADNSVGIGRSYESEKQMTTENNESNLRPRAVKRQAMREAREELADITALGKMHNMRDEADTAIAEGKSLDQFQREVNAILTERGMQSFRPADHELNYSLGLSGRDRDNFSLLNLVNGVASKDFSNCGHELEVCRAYAKQTGRKMDGMRMTVPFEALAPSRRDLTVGTDTAGGHLVATDLIAGSFIDMLRNKSVIMAAGATVLNDLVGDVAIPRQTSGATAYWVAEGDSGSESQPAFDQVTMSPHDVTAYTDLSRRLRLQSTPAAEQLVRNDLASTIATAIDLASLHGSGASNQPTGVASTTGIGSVAGGTNGLAPTYNHVVELETSVAVDNADVGSLAYITNTKIRGKLKQIFTNATYGETPLWTAGSEKGVGRLNGYPAYATNQVSSILDKGTSTGVCSAIFFGNWADLLIGMWSGVDILVDPYSLGTSGGLRIVIFQTCDIAVRHPESFAVMLDALTA